MKRRAILYQSGSNPNLRGHVQIARSLPRLLPEHTAPGVPQQKIIGSNLIISEQGCKGRFYKTLLRTIG